MGEAVGATINYAINTGRLDSRKEKLGGETTQRPDESNTNEETWATFYNLYVILSSSR